MSLIPVRSIDGKEAYLIANKPVFKPSEEAKIHILASGRKGEKIRATVLDHEKTVFSGEVSVGESLVAAVIPYTVPGKPGEYKLTLKIGEVVVDELNYIVIPDAEPRKARYLAIVWHHHQAPNYLPDGTFHAPWAFIYVYGDSLKPYGRGPYNYHALMLEKHRDYHATYNLSPSLVKQWDIAIKKGVILRTGEQLKPGDERVGLIEETLRKYVEAYKRGQIDVLTSIYAHTIGGFLIDVLGMDDIVSDEVRYGASVTREVLGVTPLGAWTPEMAFSMKMIDIYYDNNIEYTILDDKCHFEMSKGEKTSSYEPYIALNKDSGKHIVVYFRDHELSDILGFKNNFASEAHAWRNAYEASLLIARKVMSIQGRILTIALDGENWMVFSSNPPLTAFFFDKLLLFLESLSDTGILRLVSLKEAFEELPSTRILTWIPTNTWLCTFRKWRGERSEHDNYWLRAMDAYMKIKAYESIIGGRDSYSEGARWALWHALDSDYWWAEFWSPKVIEAWLQDAVSNIDKRLMGIEVKDVKTPGLITAGVKTPLGIEVNNKLDTRIKAAIVASCPGDKCRAEAEFEAPGKTTVNIQLEISVNNIGVIPLTVSIRADSYILSSITREIRIYPYIPANPR